MSKPKKFGAFAGVFTPSLLTILGVIMYMRLGWVVGQVGLYYALVIIIIAHIISVTTGLSISSIATDKKIKAGGIYYILSRSLGLPMGGAIGIALFVGTAFSISLYLIGFSESLLSVDAIREFTGLEQNINSYRIVGSLSLFVLVLIAFISTSLAIKTQFYILGAIGLSLISIFVGFYVNTDFDFHTAITLPRPDGIPLAVVFGVFFPAVTGFTAGVAMSGDLKNPKQAIPKGTLGSIIIGFIIYITLAIGLALFVDGDVLVDDVNFLQKVAWFSPLVLLGIWGATLSSALGGVLGGPRIIQSASTDRITPKIFAKGYGVNNEPRNGLILVFIIAEGGILIGELNAIAGIVSMFYLASYGFINIAFYLESWASTDFRPSFKVNKYFGLIGFVFAFGVMFQINMLYMFAALIIMGGIFFYLKRKQLKLDYGDVWQSVWSSIVRTALNRIDNSILEERNWQPNIILFSGGTQKRPYLIELGKALVGKHGVLSNFDLIEDKKEEVLFPKHKQSVKLKNTDKAIFTRRQTVKDIYQGIEMITRTYGFSGVEPNTVILGWARQSKDPKRFAQLLKVMFELDMNVLLLDYDSTKGYGKKRKIDVWWEGEGKNGNLALTLSKFMLLSDQWSDAEVRLLVVNNVNDYHDKIYIKANETLEEMRINASIKIINNQYEKYSFYEIIKKESKTSDIVFYAIPEILDGKEEKFIASTNDLLYEIGTVVLICASSHFKELHLGKMIRKSLKQRDEKESIELKHTYHLPEITYPSQEAFKVALKGVYKSFNTAHINFQKKFLHPSFEEHFLILEALRSEVIEIFKSIEYYQQTVQEEDLKKRISQLETNFLIKVNKLLNSHLIAFEQELDDHLIAGLEKVYQSFDKILSEIPEHIIVNTLYEECKVRVSDSLSTRYYKLSNRLFKSRELKKDGIPYKLNFKELTRSNFEYLYFSNIEHSFTQFGAFIIRYSTEYGRLIRMSRSSIDHLFKTNNRGETKLFKEVLEKEQEAFNNQYRVIKTDLEEFPELIHKLFLLEISQGFDRISNISSDPPLNRFTKKTKRKPINNIINTINEIPIKIKRNNAVLNVSLNAELKLLLLAYRVKRIYAQFDAEIGVLLDQIILNKSDSINKYLQKIKKIVDSAKTLKIDKASFLEEYDETDFRLSLKKLVDRTIKSISSLTLKLPKSIDLCNEEVYNDFENRQFEELELNKVSLIRYVDFQIQNYLTEKLLVFQDEFPDKVNLMVQNIKDSLRLVDFSSKIENDFEETEMADKVRLESVKKFVFDQSEIIYRNLKELKSIVEIDLSELNESKNKALEELDIRRLMRNGESYEKVARKKIREKSFQKFKNHIVSAGSIYQSQFANWLYQKSDDEVQTMATLTHSVRLNQISRLWEFKNHIIPSNEILDKIPFYYRQLFLNKQNYQQEFLFGREEEIQQSEKLIKIFNKRMGGAMMITGERLSGKTFFAHYISQTYFKDEPFYFVNPSSGGASTVNSFDEAISKATNRSGTVQKILTSIPRSCIILDNLELWWNRSENGNQVILHLSELINRYSKKHFFICVANNHSFRMMNEINNLNHLFINTIYLTPVSSKAIEEAILFRHRTGGLNLRFLLNGKDKKLREVDKARIFSEINILSKGNVGVALRLWIKSITNVKGQDIFISHLSIPEKNVYCNLDLWIKVYMQQFILHKQLTIKKLGAILDDDAMIIRKRISQLKRLELINEIEKDVFEIENFQYRFIEDAFIK